MGNKYFPAMLLALLIAGVGYAQGTAADLTLQENVTDSYIDYLQTQENTWQDQVTNVGGDTPETMKAHMGLALLGLAYTHVDGDTTFRALDSLLAEMSMASGNMFMEAYMNVALPFLFAENPHQLVNYFTEFFNSGDYAVFKDSMEVWADRFDEAAWEASWLTQMFLYNTGMHISDEEMGSHFTAIQRGTADFEFTLTFADGEFADSLFVFSRDFFNRVDVLDSLALEMLGHFEDGVIHADSVMAMTGADMSPAIAEWRMGTNTAITLIDSVKSTLRYQPFTPLDVDTSGLGEFQTGLAEIDTLLGGKVYDFGPWDEGKTIIPVVILENLPGDGLYQIYADFYRSNAPATYTFGGIFPNGLDSQTRNLLSADLVLNAMATQEEMQNHFTAQQNAWLDSLNINSQDPSAHLGLAMVELYDLMMEYPQTLMEIFSYLDMGRLDILATEYHWDDVDFSEELTSISDHMNYYVYPDGPANFVVLIKTADDEYGQFEIGENSEFDIMHLPVPMLAGAAVELQMMAEGTSMIAHGLEHLYANLDRMFILDLDPNLLDFSNIESDSMLVLRLEQANPDFLAITPYGVSEFHLAGENLRNAFWELATFFDEMVAMAEAIEPYEDDFDMDATTMMNDMQMASDLHWMLYADFANPDTTSYIDGERVNFSAWFDDPPQNFLQMWKNYVFGMDSTLGGLFPDRYSVDVQEGDLPTLPREFTVYPAYPNPFNPETNIRFDIPKSEHVTVTIFNIRGERVATLANDVLPAGQKQVQWNGAGFSSGVYYVQISYNGQTEAQKLVLLK